MVTILFPGRELVVLDVLPNGRKFNRRDFIDYIFLVLKRANLNYRHRKLRSLFWVHMDHSTCHNESQVASKFDKHHIVRSPHPPYSPYRSPCDFWLFGLLKGIMKDRKFHSHDEIEDAITVAWNDLIFEDVQCIFYD
jgi:hypothetical protein